MNLNEYFYYDEKSKSCLKWKQSRYCGEFGTVLNVNAGDDVGCATTHGYYITSLNKKRLKVHRIIYELFHGPIGNEFVIDHIDGNPSNNKIENLRKVTQKQNMQNIKIRKSNKIGVTGIEYYERPHRSPYFIASWRDGDGNKVSKAFALSIHGTEGSFMKAVAARLTAIEEMNACGAYYDLDKGVK